MKHAAMANLRKFETDPDWKVVGKRPKDFIKRLITVEANRITADQALKHSWFTNRHHGEIFELLYQQAVLDKWKPRPSAHSITVELEPASRPVPKLLTSAYLPVHEGDETRSGQQEKSTPAVTQSLMSELDIS